MKAYYRLTLLNLSDESTEFNQVFSCGASKDTGLKVGDIIKVKAFYDKYKILNIEKVPNPALITLEEVGAYKPEG